MSTGETQAHMSTGETAREITDDYDCLQVIGKGSFGTVYRAIRKSDRAQVVVKEVVITSLNEAERKCALQEASTLSKLQHDNIIHYLETRSTEGKLFIVMEFAAGGDLATAIKRRAQQQRYFSEDQIMLFFVQICLALWHVHTHNFMHRDLKSQNIFLCDNNVAKLGDFGIARSLKHTQDMANTAVGTPYYLSPEICEDKPYNSMSDVWGLGCILYEMATLKRAFEGNSLPALVTKILRGRFNPIPSRYSMQLRSLIHSMLARNPNRRPTVETILKLPWMRRHLDRCAAHMQHLSRTPAAPRQDTTCERISPAGTKSVSMLRARTSTTTTSRSRMASLSLDRATASSKQRQAQPQVKALPAPSEQSARRTKQSVHRQTSLPLQCKRPDDMVRHAYHPHSGRGGSVSPFPSSRTPTPPSSAHKAERPPWQTPRAPVKHRTADHLSAHRGKLLDRSPAVVAGRAAQVFVDGLKQPCRQSTESVESHCSKPVRSSPQSSASSTRRPRQPGSVISARQLSRERVSRSCSRGPHAECSQPELHSCKSQHVAHAESAARTVCQHTVNAQTKAQQLSAQQVPAHKSDLRERMPTIPAGIPAEPDDDAPSLSSLSSVSSHPVLSDPMPCENMGRVASSFWVPPPTMDAESPLKSPSFDSACLPVPALFCSQLESPKSKISGSQRPHTPESSRQGNAKLAPLQEAATDDGYEVVGCRSDLTSEQRRQLRSAHAQARDARKVESCASGQRLVSSTWLAGNFAALAEMQGNLGVPGMPCCTKGGAVPSKPMQRQNATHTPRSSHTDAESNDGVASHVSPQAHPLSTLDSDTDAGGVEVRAVPLLQMISQEPSELCQRGGADCDMHDAAPSLISPRGCARSAKRVQRVRSDDEYDDIMLPSSPTRCPPRQASKASPAKLSSRSTSRIAAPVRRTPALSRRSQRQTPEHAHPTHRRERTRPMNAQQRATTRQQMQESQQAHRSALQRMQPRLCRDEIRRAGKDFAARVREVISSDEAQPSSGSYQHNPAARSEAFVIPLTPRGQRKRTEVADALRVESCDGGSESVPTVERPQRRLWIAPRQDGNDSALEMSCEWKNASASVWSGVASQSQISGGDRGQKPWQNSTLRSTSRSTRSLREPVVEIYVPVSTGQPAVKTQATAQSFAAELASGDLGPGEFAGAELHEPEDATLSRIRKNDTVLMAESSESGYQRFSNHSTPSEIFDSAKQDGSLHSERRAVRNECRGSEQCLAQTDTENSDRSVGRPQDVPIADGRTPRSESREGATRGKIGELRASLQTQLGPDRLRAAYRVVRKHQCERSFDGKAERAVHSELASVLAPDSHLAYSIYRLLTLEEMSCGEMR